MLLLDKVVQKAMKQSLTAKMQIFPDPQDLQLLHDSMRAYADACTFVSDRIHADHMPLSKVKIHKAVYRDCRSLFGLPSQMAESVIKTVVASYKSIRTNLERYPEKFKKLKKKGGEIVPQFKVPQLSLVWNRDYSIVWNKEHTQRLFSVNTLKGRIKVPFRNDAMEWAFAEGAKFGTANLVYKHGKFFLHVPVTVEIPDLPEPSEYTSIVGVDRGIRFLAVAYDGEKTSFATGKTVKAKRAHYKRIRQELQKRQTSSARRRIRSMGERENRWMNDVNHCLSKALIRSNPKGTLFVLEDLTGIRSATERVFTKDRYVSVSWSYYDLEEKLKYKALRYGSNVINLNPAYTSQTCPLCRHTEKANRNKKTHLFCCRRCGYTSNDDRVAAMNLQRMGREYLLEAQVSKNDTASEEHALLIWVPSITQRCAVILEVKLQDQVTCYQRWEAYCRNLNLPLDRHKLATSVVSN